MQPAGVDTLGGMSYGYNGPTREQMEASMRSSHEANVRATARATEATQEHIEQLVAAMETQLELARASQATAERSERFARRMSWGSLAVAVASLAAAVVAIVVTLA